MVAVHKGPQAVGYRANYRMFKSLYRHAKKKLDLDITHAGAVRPSRRWACATRSNALRPIAASPEERIAAGRRRRRSWKRAARRVQNRIRGRWPCAGAQERAWPSRRSAPSPAAAFSAAAATRRRARRRGVAQGPTGRACRAAAAVRGGRGPPCAPQPRRPRTIHLLSHPA